MDSIKDIIEKARAVVAAHEAYDGSAYDSDLWHTACEAEVALMGACRGVRDTGNEAHVLAQLLVAAATHQD